MLATEPVSRRPRHRLAGILAVVVLLIVIAVVADIAWSRHRTDDGNRRAQAQGVSTVQANASTYSARLRAALARGPVTLAELDRPNGIGILGSGHTGNQATVTYQSTAHVDSSAMYGSVVSQCFADRINLAAAPPTVSHQQISCNELLSDVGVPVLTPAAR